VVVERRKRKVVEWKEERRANGAVDSVIV
jgi:hypothetical protein